MPPRRVAAPDMATVRKVLSWVRRMDWVSRHDMVASLVVNHPELGNAVLHHLADDEHLDGRNKCVPVHGVIPLSDKPKGVKRSQTTLEHFGFVARRR